MFAGSEEDDRQVVFSGPHFKATFDKQSGLLVSYRYKKQEYIHNGQGPRPFFWRAPTDNDYGAKLPIRLKAWKEASYQEPKAESFNVVRDKDITAVKVTYRFPQTDARWDITYKVYGNGVIKVDNHFVAENAQTPMIPRVGLRMQLPARITSLTYYGRGPEENYRDRRTSQFIGEYTSGIQDMYEPYVRPQENGHRTDTRWVELTRKGGKGLLIRADSTIGFNALRNSVEDFDSEEAISRPRQWTNFTPEEVANHNEEKAKNVIRRMTHVNDITPRNFVEVCIDMKQQGIAGYDSWGDRPLPEHTLPANKEYHWGFTLMPVK